MALMSVLELREDFFIPLRISLRILGMSYPISPIRYLLSAFSWSNLLILMELSLEIWSSSSIISEFFWVLRIWRLSWRFRKVDRLLSGSFRVGLRRMFLEALDRGVSTLVGGLLE